jgi:hypothetical protein
MPPRALECDESACLLCLGSQVFVNVMQSDAKVDTLVKF